jgi:hypothetical protein
MMRPPFVGHRRYSITHRAVQRLRELCPGRDDEDDETLRDRLDEALGSAEDSGRAIRTLDAMLGEPQTLIPIDAFGDVLYAIIKEDTVVTVLPRGHGEEILQRGQAMEQRVAAGQVTMRHGDRDRDKERWGEAPRRRWQKDTQAPVVIERVRGNGAPFSRPSGLEGSRPEGGNGTEPYGLRGSWADESEPEPAPVEQRVADPSALVVRLPHSPGSRPSGAEGVVATHAPSGPVAHAASALAPSTPGLAVRARAPSGAKAEPPKSGELGPVAQTIHDALELGRRRAAVLALREALSEGDREESLLPLWNALAQQGIPHSLTVGDLLEALRGLE